MRFLICGAGAVGGVVGARLHLAGYDVALLARGDHLRAIRADGLRLDAPGASTTVRLPASDDVADLEPASVTHVLLTTKSQHTAAMLESLSGRVPAETEVACVQNGVANEPAALRHFAHVIAVNVNLPATHLEPGIVEEHSAPVPGILDVGRYPHAVDDGVRGLAAAFRAAGFDSVDREDVMAWKRRKLIGNLANAVQAAFAASPAREELAEVVREEGERTLAAAGLDVVDADRDAARRGSLLTSGTNARRRGGSTWQSLERGRSVESDYLNGEIVLTGRLHGVPTPANELVRSAVLAAARQHQEPATADASEALAELRRAGAVR